MRTYRVTVNQFNNVRWKNEAGELHREEGPAIEFHNGGKQWYINGELHREEGPAIEFHDGGKQWYINGELHRRDGPAVEFANGNNHKEWFIHGKRHREDGPARIGADGAKEWHLEGVELTEEEFNKRTSEARHSTPEKITIDINSLPVTIIIDGKDYIITRRAYGKIHINPKE